MCFANNIANCMQTLDFAMHKAFAVMLPVYNADWVCILLTNGSLPYKLGSEGGGGGGGGEHSIGKEAHMM